MEQDVLVLTPEKTIVSYRLAGLGSRVLGHLLDIVILVAAYVVIAVSLSLLVTVDPALANGIFLFLGFALPLGYFVLFEGLWNGQTLGKKAAGLRVRMSDGTPITFAASLGRNLLRPADILPGVYFVGLMAMFTNPRAQRVGDLVANTIVVQDGRPEPRFTVTPHSVGFHPLEESVGELKGMTVAEYNALRRFADRFPELPPSIQERITQQVWVPLARRRGIPSYSNIHPIYLAEAAVMKYGREHGLL